MCSEQAMESKLKRLDFLLSKSMTYSNILATRLAESQKVEEKRRQAAAEKAKANNASVSSSARSSAARKGKGKKRVAEDEDDSDAEVASLLADTSENAESSTTLKQPPLITVPLREYQLHGVQWSEFLCRPRFGLPKLWR